MKVTLKINGIVQVLLEPESAIERAVVETMTERAAKGAHVTLESSDGAERGMVLSMEQSA